MERLTKLKLSRGAGMAIITFSVVIMVYMAVTAIGILNSKILIQEYGRLRNTVEAAASGSVIHVSMSDDNQKELSMGYIISDAGASDVNTGDTNNYYKLDHQLANKYTLELIKRSMNISTADIGNTSKVKILMVVIQPEYNETTYQRSYKIYYYGNDDPVNPKATDTVPNTGVGGSFSGVETAINTFLSSSAAAPYKSATRTYSININNTDNTKSYINKLTNNQYYLVLVNDFPLMTLMPNKSSDAANFTPICSMQASKSSRD